MLTNDLFNDGNHLCDCETFLCFPDAIRRGLFVFVESVLLRVNNDRDILN